MTKAPFHSRPCLLTITGVNVGYWIEEPWRLWTDLVTGEDACTEFYPLYTELCCSVYWLLWSGQVRSAKHIA